MSMKINILIVEDDFTSQMLLKMVVKSIGDNIYTTDNGTDAIEIFKNNPINLVITDLRLYDINGLDGFKTTKAIRELNKDVIIIAQSAYVFNEEIKSIKELGANYFIPKPIDKSVLFHYIKKHFPI